jgi:S1-C subfamily serine protease
MKVESTSEQLFFTTAFLSGLNSDGAPVTATGFFYKVLTDKGEVDLLITNRHVLAAFEKLTLKLIRGGENDSPILGEFVSVEIKDFQNSGWVGHPNPQIDIAVIAVNPFFAPLVAEGSKIFYKTVSPEIVLSDEESEDLDAIESILFVGYPAGIFDTKHHLPLIRRGITASPLSVDFNGIPTFAIDAGVYQGSSGSPVFIWDNGWITDRSGNITTGSRLKLLGVVSENFQRESVGKVETEDAVQFARYKEAIGLGIVVKAKCIDECVDVYLKQYNHLLIRRSAK